MRPIQYATEKLMRAFAAHMVLNLEQVKAALGTPVKMTALRKLRQLDYHSSYSHAGRYYTLERLARWDGHGLWARWIGMMPRPTASGPESDCPQRRSGNGRLGAMTAGRFPGVGTDRTRTFGRIPATAAAATRVIAMASCARPRWAAFRLGAHPSGWRIWPAMSGNGSPTGIVTGTTLRGLTWHRPDRTAESAKVLRGGSWISYPFMLRSSYRGKHEPQMRHNYEGFRCARQTR